MTLSFGVGLRLLEMILLLPWPIFNLVAYFIGLPMSEFCAPGQLDIASGRRTEEAKNIEELVSAGMRHSSPLPVCSAVLRLLQSLEENQGGGTSCNSLQALTSKAELLGVIGDSNSIAEYRFWIVRLLTLISFLVAFYFFLVHE